MTDPDANASQWPVEVRAILGLTLAPIEHPSDTLAAILGPYDQDDEEEDEEDDDEEPADDRMEFPGHEGM